MLKVLLLLALAAAVFGQAVTLTSANFDELVTSSGKNSFIKFFAPWCGHCKAMKPAWDELGTEFASSSSVIIGDVDCTVEADLCQKFDVSGYPTIKYWTPEEQGVKYAGGRDLASLKKHVTDKLERKCDVATGAGCSDKEQKFITQMKEKGADEIAKQLTRLEGMKSQKMTTELKAWLFQRINILKQLSKKDEL